MNKVQTPGLSPSVLWLMAIASGLTVANNYYSQPLLVLIAGDFGVSESSVGNVAMITQIGYALGLLSLVPLADLFKRKRLIIADFGFIFLSLLGMATSPNIYVLIFFSFTTGLTSVVPQIFVPMAASLASPEKRAGAIGFVMSGLLIGILGSRILSGWIGTMYGWRSMFFIAAAISLVLWIMLKWKLPEVYPTYKGSYASLMKSVLTYARTEPLLQAATLRGALAFASFSAFWTALVFHLGEAPFHAGSAVAGSFGLAGMTGALIAAHISKIARRFPYFPLATVFILIFIFSWGVLWLGGYTYTGLILGVLILDVAMQAIHIMNQYSIFSLHPEANNRINTVYMTFYFVGGALGTFSSALSWQYWGWHGVLLTGAGFGLLALLAHYVYKGFYKELKKS